MLRAVASGPPEFEVLLETGIEDARDQVPTVASSREATEGGVLMRGTADYLAWTARLLAGLSCPCAVRRSQELGHALGLHATGLARLAERTGDKGTS